jgi:hypothetical protein
MTIIWNTVARFVARPAVADWLICRAQRTPYSPIVKDGELYMERFWLFNAYPDTGASGADRKPWRFPISIRIHRIVLPDQDRDLHDHPWNARTFILRGGYKEVRRVVSSGSSMYDRQAEAWVPLSYSEDYDRIAGDTVSLRFGEYHRITQVSPGGVWTLFVTGKYRGTWGFLVDGAKVQWRRYLGIEPAAAQADMVGPDTTTGARNGR